MSVMQGGEPCPCWLSTAVDSRCYLLIIDISKGSCGLTESITDTLSTWLYLIMEHMVTVWCSTIFKIFFNVFLHLIPHSFFCCFLMCLPFFLVSNYPLFSDTSVPLSSSTVSHLPVHTYFFSPLKMTTRWFPKNANYI